MRNPVHPDRPPGVIRLPRVTMARAGRGVVLGLSLVLAGCGSGGGSGSSSNAPTIENLRVAYSPASPVVGAQVQIQFIVDVVDPDGDWVLGHCQFVTGDQVELPIETVAGANVPPNATSGTAVCPLLETFANSQTQVDLTVVDQAGHRSNVLSAIVTLERGQGRPR